MNYLPMTLGWFLYESSIDNLEFIGNTAALNEPITGINVLDNPDGIHWIKKNELVLSTGYIFKDDPKMQQRIIKELSEIHCTAFCIKVKRFFDQIPELMIREAADYGLSLIAVPFYHSYADIMDVVFQQLANNNLKIQRYVLEETEKMYHLLFQNEGIMKMLQQVSAITAAASMITTFTGLPLYHYIPESDSLLFRESHNLKIRPIPSARKSSQSPQLQTFLFNNNQINVTAFLLPNRNHYLCIDTSQKPLTEETRQILQKALPIITLQLENIQQSNRYQISRNSYQSFFNLLSDIHSKSVEEVKMICTAYGFRHDGKKICLTLEAEPELFDQQFFKSFYTDVEQRLKKFGAQYFLCFHEHRVVVFLFYPRSHPNLQVVNHAVHTANQLFSELKDYQNEIRIGISRCHTRLISIAAAYEESLRAINLQIQLKQPQRVTSSLTQTAYYLLDQINQRELKKLYRDTVMILVQYDKDNNTDLLPILKTYYQCRLNISETAKVLFLHRNTLTVRLNLIREILGLELDDMSELFTIYLGICAYELMQE